MADDEPFDNIKIEAEDEDEDVYEESGRYIFQFSLYFFRQISVMLFKSEDMLVNLKTY